MVPSSIKSIIKKSMKRFRRKDVWRESRTVNIGVVGTCGCMIQ